MNIEDIEIIARGLSVRTYLATTNPAMEPHVVPVHPAWEGTTIWIMTSRSSVKARNIEANPTVAMHWETNEAGDGILVWGAATTHGDRATKQRLWTGVFDYDLDEFAPDGINDPATVFVAVEPQRAVHALAYGAGGVQRWARHPRNA